MRINNASMIRNHMYDTQQNLTRMSKINEQINSGKVVNRVSDDPHKAIRIMNLNNEIRYTEKYNYNVDEVVGWMETTDGSLEHFTNTLGDIKEEILKVGNGTYSTEELRALQAEMNEKIKDLADSLNTTYAGKHMFGGTHVDEPPIKAVTGDDGIVRLELNANINSNDLKADISEGIGIDYNLSADEIFKIKRDKDGNVTDEGLLGEINKLSETMNKVVAGDKDAKKELLGPLKDSLDSLYNNALDERTSLGVRENTAEKVKNLNDENILSMKSVLSMDQDVDHVEKFIELKSAELVYQASIKIGATLIQPTILDYMR